jgi:hypothetical protein
MFLIHFNLKNSLLIHSKYERTCQILHSNLLNSILKSNSQSLTTLENISIFSNDLSIIESNQWIVQELLFSSLNLLYMIFTVSFENISFSLVILFACLRLFN